MMVALIRRMISKRGAVDSAALRVALGWTKELLLLLAGGKTGAIKLDSYIADAANFMFGNCDVCQPREQTCFMISSVATDLQYLASQQALAAPTPQSYLNAIAQQTKPLNTALNCGAYAGLAGTASFLGVGPSPNPALSLASGTRTILTTSGREGVGAAVASGAKILGPAVATALGEIAAKNVSKIVPFALAVQGGIASKDAYRCLCNMCCTAVGGTVLKSIFQEHDDDPNAKALHRRSGSTIVSGFIVADTLALLGQVSSTSSLSARWGRRMDRFCACLLSATADHAIYSW